MTPRPWVEYAAAALARERERPCKEPTAWNMNSDGARWITRCTLRAGHVGAHR